MSDFLIVHKKTFGDDDADSRVFINVDNISYFEKAYAGDGTRITMVNSFENGALDIEVVESVEWVVDILNKGGLIE